jgi:hypothetical protein
MGDEACATGQNIVSELMGLRTLTEMDLLMPSAPTLLEEALKVEMIVIIETTKSNLEPKFVLIIIP